MASLVKLMSECLAKQVALNDHLCHPMLILEQARSSWLPFYQNWHEGKYHLSQAPPEV